MPSYQVCFWSGERTHVVSCDIRAEDDHGLLEGFARAGRYAVDLRRRTLPALADALRPSPVEFRWLAFICGPAWLYVAVSYWLG